MTEDRAAYIAPPPASPPRHILWIVVTCPECSRTLCLATAGSVVKITCKRCKQASVIHVA